MNEKLPKPQNRAARVMTGDTYDIHSKDILITEIIMENLYERRKEKASSYVSKAITGDCPVNISKKFKMAHSERHDLRSNDKLIIMIIISSLDLKYIQLVETLQKT